MARLYKFGPYIKEGSKIRNAVESAGDQALKKTLSDLYAAVGEEFERIKEEASKDATRWIDQIEPLVGKGIFKRQ